MTHAVGLRGHNFGLAHSLLGVISDCRHVRVQLLFKLPFWRRFRIQFSQVLLPQFSRAYYTAD